MCVCACVHKFPMYRIRFGTLVLVGIIMHDIIRKRSKTKDTNMYIKAYQT